MKIITKQIKGIEIFIATPEEGCYLTQANRSEDQEPIMSESVHLLSEDSQHNWTDITIAEGDAIVAQWQAEQELKMQQEMNNL